MNFLDYPAYVMGCLGVGDILCSYNALENIGRERNRSIDVYVVHPEYARRARDIYDALDLRQVTLHCCDFSSVVARFGEGQYTVFQAFGMEVSWVKGWLWGWGLRSSIGHDNMVFFKNRSVARTETVGVSFTVNSHPTKNISPGAILKLVTGLLEEGHEVMYFGFRRETDDWLEQHFGAQLHYCPYDLRETISSMAVCRRFIGADSGMSWLAAFHRLETRILVGGAFGGLPNTFGDIPWVSIELGD